MDFELKLDRIKEKQILDYHDKKLYCWIMSRLIIYDSVFSISTKAKNDFKHHLMIKTLNRIY